MWEASKTAPFSLQKCQHIFCAYVLEEKSERVVNINILISIIIYINISTIEHLPSQRGKLSKREKVQVEHGLQGQTVLSS